MPLEDKHEIQYPVSWYTAKHKPIKSKAWCHGESQDKNFIPVEESVLVVHQRFMARSSSREWKRILIYFQGYKSSLRRSRVEVSAIYVEADIGQVLDVEQSNKLAGVVFRRGCTIYEKYLKK